MKIVLDTNVIVRDYRLSGHHFKILFDGLARLGYSLVIPQIVIDESVNNYRKDLMKASKAFIDLGRLIGNENIIQINDAQIKNWISDYDKFLKTSFTKDKCSILGYPKISHQQLVQRSINGKKPFKEKGTGYQDALIWESVIELAKTVQEPILAFISENKLDFSYNGSLHPDLHDTTKTLPCQVIYYDSLENFINKEVVPKLDELKEIGRQISQNKHPFIDREKILDEFPYFPNQNLASVSIHGFSKDFKGIYIHDIKKTIKVGDTDVHKLTDSELIVTFAAITVSEFHFQITKDDYSILPESTIKKIDVFDRDDDLLTAAILTEVYMTLSVIFDIRLAELISVFAIILEDEWRKSNLEDFRTPI